MDSLMTGSQFPRLDLTYKGSVAKVAVFGAIELLETNFPFIQFVQ